MSNLYSSVITLITPFGPENSLLNVGGQVSPLAIWVHSLAFKSWLPGFPRPKWPRPPCSPLEAVIPISRHVRPVKHTWPGVTYLACNSGHVSRLTWPQGLTWLVTPTLFVSPITGLPGFLVFTADFFLRIY